MSKSTIYARLWLGGAIIVLLLLAGCTPGAAGNIATQRTATISRGTLVSTVNATGNVQPEAILNLTFDQAGTVAEVHVKTGDLVKKGDILAKLDDSDQQLTLASAQTALIQANATYSRTIEGPRQADIDAAQAALDAALVNYDKTKQGPQPEDYASVEAALRNAEAALKQAQNSYDQAFRNNPAGIGGSLEATNLELATNNYNAAKASFDSATTPPDNAQMSAAWQQVQNARASLDKLKQPVKQFDLDQANAQQKQAQVQYDQAKRRVGQTLLLAPRDGLITDVSIKVGELTGATPAVTLVDLSKLHIDITVDEIDIAKIRTGQEVAITLDAIPDVTLKGTIDRIAPTSSTISGVVSYSVRVLIAEQNPALKAGMTASTSVILERRENVLIVPNWAIRRDKQSGKSFLNTKVDDRTSKEVEVAVGLRNETSTEILSGVTEGQVILAPQASSFFSQ